ncbi:MAG: polymerase subunit epsilon [Pseudomonadota bacterium]|jgi:DNA polymerase-3 subunit epsilon
MLREIVLDTETTGLEAAGGDRLIEIGCIELLNRIPTGNEYHQYINPEERAVHPEAEAVHGISNAFLKDKPPFRDVARKFIDFVGDGHLVIHNAAFDMGFINMELGRIGLQQIPSTNVVDTLALARRKHPAGPNTLDALCKRYGIDNSRRVKHGALMDAELLAEVYIELLGERQAMLGLATDDLERASGSRHGRRTARKRPSPLVGRLGDDDVAAHRAFVETLGDDALWLTYLEPGGNSEAA